MTRHCTFPGCGTRLAKHNLAGLCQVHMHTRNLCRCDKCRKLTVFRAEPKQRDGVRVAEVSEAMAFSTNSDRRVVRVSLRVEPWGQK